MLLAVARGWCGLSVSVAEGSVSDDTATDSVQPGAACSAVINHVRSRLLLRCCRVCSVLQRQIRRASDLHLIQRLQLRRRQRPAVMTLSQDW